TPPTGAFHSRNGPRLAGANARRLVPRAAAPSVLSLRLQPEAGLGAGTVWYRTAGGNRSPRLPAQKRANTSGRGGRWCVRGSGELSWRRSEIAVVAVVSAAIVIKIAEAITFIPAVASVVLVRKISG